jgi:hypothetical protein
MNQPAPRPQPPAIRPPTSPGDICPRFELLDAATMEKVDVFGDAEAGHPALFLFAGNGTRHLDAVAKQAQAIADLGVRVFAIGPPELADKAGPFRYLRDVQNGVAGGYGLWPRGGLIAVGANQHALYLGANVDAALAAFAAHNALRVGGRAPLHPPVLQAPGIFTRAECEKLIGIYTMRGNTFVEPGHGDKGMTSDYKMRIPDYGRGDRIDHFVVDADTNAFIDDLLHRRLFPEIRKAFQYRITKREPYRIACYEGERGGSMHGHRDNSAALVAHRRFALSINLNGDRYDGGELRFLEYGLQNYKPEQGEALVFSSSLLHEVQGVTSGRRLVLLAFLFGYT